MRLSIWNSLSRGNRRSIGKAGFAAVALFAGTLGLATAQDEAPQLSPPGGGAAGTPDEAPTVEISDDPALVFGEFTLDQKRPVVDGDTLRVVEQKRSLRLLAIDTEEVPHSDQEGDLIILMREDFPAYRARRTFNQVLPMKFATPLGDEASAFARSFLKGVKRVRLERDVAGVDEGTYGRTLCFVWALYEDGSAPKLYNLEAVRAGMSPYYVKYGRSQRFHEAFTAAQEEARRNKAGIWNPEGQHYGDYERRLAWWNRRAEALDRFAQISQKSPEKAPLQLGGREAIQNLLNRLDDDGKLEEAYVFGLVDDHDTEAVRVHENGATLR
ncbi:MAG: thermonuclease family protein, partial [Planctomycetota bacterium]